MFFRSLTTRLMALFLALALCSVAQSQDLVKRHSFARSYFGPQVNYVFSLPDAPLLDEAGAIHYYKRHAFFTPALNLRATHFWGHADFFVSFAFNPIKTAPDLVANPVRYRAITGMRVYPWRLETNRVRPFVGYRFAPIRLNQDNLKGDHFVNTRVKSMFEVGIGYQTAKKYAFVGYSYTLNPETELYLSRTTRSATTFPAHALGMGVHFLFETTEGSFGKKAQQLDSLLNQQNRYGLFLAIGPSSAFPTRSSVYLQANHPFLDDLAMPAVFPDVSVGYHFTKQDFALSLSFRPIRQLREAFQFTQIIRSQVFSLDAFKFLFDYHGFVPFVGAGLGYGRAQLIEEDQGNRILNLTYRAWHPSIVLGWDIRPGKKADTWLLRTNLRYAPTRELAVGGKPLSLQFLEFNFIQLVVFPQKIGK